MWARIFTVLEGLHALHLLHAVCSGVEDLVDGARASELPEHAGENPIAPLLTNATPLTAAQQLQWIRYDGAIGLMVPPEQLPATAALENCSAATPWCVGLPATVGHARDDDLLARGGLLEAARGSHQQPAGSLGHHVAFAQLGAVVLFEALMSVSGCGCRAGASKVLLAFILAGAQAPQPPPGHASLPPVR